VVEAAAARQQHPDAGPYFHGGAPGLPEGAVLVSAKELGVFYQYFSRYAVHGPAWTYVTTDEGVAAGFASRYCTRDGQEVPGDVYEVQPLGALQPDPDYACFPTVFLRCRRARILRRVASSVSLTADEQRAREGRYRVWGRVDAPIWDEDGVINPSEQMLGNGVTREWTALLRPWLDPEDFDAKGRLTIALRAGRDPSREGEPWRTILDVVPALDRDCQVRKLRVLRVPGLWPAARRPGPRGRASARRARHAADRPHPRLGERAGPARRDRRTGPGRNRQEPDAMAVVARRAVDNGEHWHEPASPVAPCQHANASNDPDAAT
jgi:hypothetical protein